LLGHPGIKSLVHRGGEGDQIGLLMQRETDEGDEVGKEAVAPDLRAGAY
jgi:hypothetical protein